MLIGDGLAARAGRRRALLLIAMGVPALVVPVLVGERRWRAERSTGVGGSADGAAGPTCAAGLAGAWGSPDGTAALPSVTVLIAARDEARALPNLLADLGRQDHREPDGRPRLDVVVVDDRSSDGTGTVAQREAAIAGIGGVTTIVRREGAGLADGKGAALAAVAPERLRGDVVVVLDADARIDPSFLRLIATQMAAGGPAVSCPISIVREGSMLSAAQADEQRLDLAIQRARFAFGGLSELRGNGMVVRRDVLNAAGGWRPALTEDLDLSSRLAALGHRIGVARGVEIRADGVGSLPMLWAQRMRWSEGALRRLFEHGWSVLMARTLGLIAKADFAIYAGQLALPGVIVGAAVGAVRRGRPTAVAALLATWGLALLIIGRSVPAVLLSGLWIAAVPASAIRLAFRRGPVRYAKMDHHGYTAGQDEQPGSA